MDDAPDSSFFSGRKIAADISSTVQKHQQQQTSVKQDRAQWSLLNAEVYQVLNESLQQAQDLYQQRYGDNDTQHDMEINQKIIDALSTAIANGHWEGGLLFEAAGKELKRLRERLIKGFQLKDTQSDADDAQEKVTIKPGYQQVYIALYATAGDKLHEWEKLLSVLPAKSVGRPVYESEEDVKAFIASRPVRTKDAFVAVQVKDEDIITPRGRAHYNEDRDGRPLLLIRETAVQLVNIIKFENFSGSYTYKHERLNKITP